MGALCLIPPIFMLVIAVLTRKTTSSLLLTIILAYIMMHGVHFLMPMIDLIYTVGMDGDTIWVLMFIALLGIVIAMLEISGAKQAFLKIMWHFSKTPKGCMTSNWFLSFPLFIDDWANSVVQASMIPVYNKHKIPRASLAYIIDASAAPLAVLIPITSWAIFYQSVFANYDQLSVYGTTMQLYVKSIPFMFYGWAALIISLLFARQIIPPLGAMKKAYKRRDETGALWGPESDKFNPEGAVVDMDNAGIQTKRPVSDTWKLICFFVPIMIILIGTVVTGDIVIGCWIAILAGIPLYLIIGVASWDNLMTACVDGVKDMIGLILIIFCAYMFREVLAELGLADFVVNAVEPYMSAALLPAITFVVTAAIAFMTGSNWSIVVIMSTIIMPLCEAVGANPLIAIGAIVSGASFGAHICFYTDCTVFTSTVSKIDNMEHALTQVPYGSIGAAISTVLFLICGFVFQV